MVDALLYAGGVLFVILGIAVSIAVHELGHLWPAKKFGVRVKQYMIGFGPTVFSRRRGETEYGIKAIPLGGYISMIGMFPPSNKPATGPFSKVVNEARETSAEEVTPQDKGREFWRLHPAKKLVIMLGGPTMNLILGIALILVALSALGVNQAVPKISEVAQCWVPDGEECTAQDTPTPALLAGLQSGDQILEVQGVPVQRWQEADRLLSELEPGSKVLLLVGRDDTQFEAIVEPLWVETPTGFVPRLGIYLVSERVTLPFEESVGFVGESLGAVFGLIISLPAAVWDVALSLFTDDARDPNGPISILGVGQLAGEVAATEQLSFEARLSTGLLILGSLNFALFAFNLIPLLPLDGGHVVGAIYESGKRGLAKITRRAPYAPVDTARLVPLAYFVWIVLIAVGLLLILADLIKPVSL